MQSNISFGSRFKPTGSLNHGFKLIQENERNYGANEFHQFAKSIEMILNDEKEDVIEITKNTHKDVWVAKVGKTKLLEKRVTADHPFGKGKNFIDFLTSLAECRNPKANVEELSDYEIDAIKPLVSDLIESTDKNSNKVNLLELFEKLKDVKTKICEVNIDRIFKKQKPEIFK